MFEGSRLKIERAKKHINDLNAEIAAYAARKPWVFVIEPEDGGQRCAFVARNREPLPPHLTLIVGDAIHNLRSALDYLACDIVRPTLTAGEDLADTYFPIFKIPAPTANDLTSRFHQTKVDRASPKIMDVFRSLDLSSRGELYTIHSLDIEDKHRNLLAVGSAGVMPTLTGRNFLFAGNIMANLRDGQKAIVMPLPQNAKFGDEIASAIYVHFGQGLPGMSLRLTLEPAVKALANLTTMIEGVINRFETASR